MADQDRSRSADAAESGRTTREDPDARPPRKLGTSIVVGALGVFSVVYLLNPTAGFIEFIPDNVPIFGNLDEAAITALLITCLAYFGIDVRRIFGFRDEARKRDEAIDVESHEEG